MISVTAPAAALLDVKVAGARLAVITPDKVTAASARIPTRSVPRAVLKIIGLLSEVALAK